MTTHQFVEKNITAEPYLTVGRFYIEDYYPSISLKELPQHLHDMAQRDMDLFAEREKARLKEHLPLVGDIILKKDGTKTYVGEFTFNGFFQDTPGGSFYLGSNGHMSYSGGFTMDVLHIRDLELVNELGEVHCWLFSGDDWGANRGVYHKIKVKTWKQI